MSSRCRCSRPSDELLAGHPRVRLIVSLVGFIGGNVLTSVLLISYLGLSLGMWDMFVAVTVVQILGSIIVLFVVLASMGGYQAAKIVDAKLRKPIVKKLLRKED